MFETSICMLRKNEKDRNSCQMKIFYQICLAGSLCREEAKLYELKRKDLVDIELQDKSILGFEFEPHLTYFLSL